MNAAGFRDIVRGGSRGPVAGLLRLGLSCIEPFYAAAVAWRNRRYDLEKAAIFRVKTPVVSVGNLTLGGVGKTPMIAWLARWFAERGRRPVIISRGYGRAKQGANDEAIELERQLPGVVHLQNPDRVAAANEAEREHQPDVLLLDDAFQHRRLARTLDLVLLDASEPFGFGRLFPRGLLREPPGGLRRAHAVVLTRSDMRSAADRDAIRREVARLSPNAVWAEAVHAPTCLVAADGAQLPLETCADESIAAFCGIGNPAGFQHSLDACGFQTLDLLEFPDHHAYSESDLHRLESWVKHIGAQAVICTAKDLVKMPQPAIAGRPLYALAVEMKFHAGQPELESLLETVVA